MVKDFHPKIVSANDLLSGDVVYLDATGAWTRALRDAAVARTPDAADELEAASHQPDKVVGPYLLDVRIDDRGWPVPSHFREKFRDRGPTIRTDLGRQAQIIPQRTPLASGGGL